HLMLDDRVAVHRAGVGRRLPRHLGARAIHASRARPVDASPAVLAGEDLDAALGGGGEEAGAAPFGDEGTKTVGGRRARGCCGAHAATRISADAAGGGAEVTRETCAPST